MIGIVVVSHSRRLAESAVELALEMVRGTPPAIEIAAGLDDHVLGTDAARVKGRRSHDARSDRVRAASARSPARSLCVDRVANRGPGPRSTVRPKGERSLR